VTLLRLLAGIVAALALSWVALLVLLTAARPRGMSITEARRVVPDIARLLRDLARDDTLPPAVRRRLTVALLYLASPVDLVPDFIPVIGYVDDVIVVALVLRSVIRRAGSDVVERHWQGTSDGLAFVKRLADVK
jgi:uncharacterized membrane protein YkvA (DUF1232 family)